MNKIRPSLAVGPSSAFKRHESVSKGFFPSIVFCCLCRNLEEVSCFCLMITVAQSSNNMCQSGSQYFSTKKHYEPQVAVFDECNHVCLYYGTSTQNQQTSLVYPWGNVTHIIKTRWLVCRMDIDYETRNGKQKHVTSVYKKSFAQRSAASWVLLVTTLEPPL